MGCLSVDPADQIDLRARPLRAFLRRFHMSSATAPSVAATPRGRPPRSHDNGAVRAWLRHYIDARDFCARHPRAEDVLVGSARARERRDTGRGLNKWKLFVVLQSLDAITSSGVAEILKCAERTARTYAIAAEIASRAIAPLSADGLCAEELDDTVPDVLTYQHGF